MGFYRRVILPRLCDAAMRNRLIVPHRKRVVGEAEGRVLEIGAGSGLNFTFYSPRTTEVVALEPDPALVDMARSKAQAATTPIRFAEASAEAIPLEDRSVDTVVSTWTLCTIPHAHRALEEARRVLKPGGRLLFVEHGLAPTADVQRWQHRLTPVWRRIAGGCHLDRPIDSLIRGAGFAIDALDTGYIPGPKVMTFLYEGAASPR